MRKHIALIATAGLLMAALTACSGPGAAAADCDALATDGPASGLVSATGELGSAPVVDFPTPLKTDSTQRTVLIEGEGEPARSGQQLSLQYSAYDGSTGELVEQSPYDAASPQLVTLNDEAFSGYRLGLTCAQAGSRVAIVLPAEGVLPPTSDAAGADSVNDSVVIVVDVIKTYLARADGADQAPEAGLPSVVLNEDGRPGITVPAGDKPSELEVGLLKKGSGERVEQGQIVTVHYTGVLWGDTPESSDMFESTWEAGAPTLLPAWDNTTQENGLVPGLATALIGQTVGSQFIAVIPPDLGYGAGTSGTIPPNSTLIFVVDILGVD